MRERNFSHRAYRVLVKNPRRNIGVFEQIKYYLRFHQIVGGIDFFHATMYLNSINRLIEQDYVVQKFTNISYHRRQHNTE